MHTHGEASALRGSPGDLSTEHPSHLLVFDPDGVTGHPDHRHATQAALTAAHAAGLP